MIGGEDEVGGAARPDLQDDRARRRQRRAHARAGPGPTAPRREGYLHCGPNGAGHFVKMVHNGVEYGMMAAIAEGLSIIKHADAGKHATRASTPRPRPLRDPEAYQYDIDVAEVAEVWRRGSVVGSWLVDLTADALRPLARAGRLRRPGLRLRRGPLDGARRGRRGRPGPGHHRRRSTSGSSRAGSGEFTDKILSAMRSEFGGHAEKKQRSRRAVPASHLRPRPPMSL